MGGYDGEVPRQAQVMKRQPFRSLAYCRQSFTKSARGQAVALASTNLPSSAGVLSARRRLPWFARNAIALCARHLRDVRVPKSTKIIVSGSLTRGGTSVPRQLTTGMLMVIDAGGTDSQSKLLTRNHSRRDHTAFAATLCLSPLVDSQIHCIQK